MNKTLYTKERLFFMGIRFCLILFYILAYGQPILNDLKANNNLISKNKPESTPSFRSYTTIRNGYWNSPSTWQGGLVPNEYLGGDVVNINHMVTWNRGNDLYLQSGTLNVSGVLTIPDANVKMESSAGVININRGLIKIIDDNLENKSGRINFTYGAVQLCNGNYTDESRHGSHGIGYIFSKNGNIEDKRSGNFSTGIAWCIDNGGGVGLPTRENCAAARPPGGNCNNMNFYLTKPPEDEDCDNGLDDDGDGLVDCNDPDCGKPQINSATPIHLNCPIGVNNGQINISASGANLQYRLNTTAWQNGTNFSNLASGTYTVYVKNNATNCEATTTLVLQSASSCPEDCTNGLDDDGDGLVDCNDPDCGNPIINNINLTHLSCPSNEDNGQISITASGDNLHYRLDDSGWQSESYFINLAAGAYTIYVSNLVSNCETSLVVTLNPATACDEDCSNGIDDDGDGLVDCEDLDCGTSITATDLVHPFCPNGENSGQINISASGANLYYRLHHTEWQNSPSFSNLTAGNYTIFVKNVISGCESSTLTTLNPSGTCIEDCTNGIDDDGDGLIDCDDPDCSNPTIDNLVPTHLSCPANTNNGSISITAGGADLLYRLNTTDWQPGSSFMNLSAATYTVFVQNTTTGCEVSSSITLNSASGCVEDCTNGIDDDGDGLIDCNDPDCNTPSLDNINLTHLSCPANTNNGTINIVSSGSNISYRLNTTDWQTKPNFTHLAAGTYTLYARNVNGCEISTMVTLNPATGCVEDCNNGIDDDGDGLIDCLDPDCGTPVLVNITPTHLSCPANTDNGAINISATGADLSYSLNGIDWQSSAYFMQLAAGTHTVYVKINTTGCQISNSITLSSASDCVEDCTNGIDDDGDGLVDCDDADCAESLICEIGCNAYEGNIVFDVTSNYADPNNITQYLLTDDLRIIRQISNTASFTNVSAGDYFIYIINYAFSDGIIGNNIGATINDLSSDCFMLSDGFPFRVCSSFDCTVNAENDAFSILCPGISISGNVSYNDEVTNTTRFYVTTFPSGGTLDFDTLSGDFTYTPYDLACRDAHFSYRLFEAEGCSNEANVILSIGDSIVPELTNIPIDLTINCDEEIPYTDLVSAADNCPSISIDVVETSTQGEEGCTLYDYQLTRTWTALDVCGNYTTAQQIIEIEDKTAPDIYRVYTLPNGKKMVAGVMENITHRWKTIQLPIDFPSQPLVFTQVFSINEASLVTVKLRNISANQFEIRLQEEESNDNVRTGESVSWIAVESGGSGLNFKSEIGNINVGDSWTTHSFSETFSKSPSFFASIQSVFQSDPIIPRYQNLSANGIQLKTAEETSQDSETMHSNERVAYWALDQVGTIYNDKGRVIGEVGTIDLDHGIIVLNTVNEYFNPVVIANCLSSNDGEPVAVRIRKLSNSSFELFLQEWDYQDDNHGLESVSVMVLEGSIPLASVDFCIDGTDSLVLGQDIIAVDNCDINVELAYEDTTYFVGPEKITLRIWSAIDECGNGTAYTQYVACSGVSLQVKACLQGAIIRETEAGLMRDDLRRKGLLPLIEPYTELANFQHKGAGGEEELNPTLLTITGDNALVDWVLIELRAGDNPSNVLSTIAGLIQRDGDVVTAKGDSILNFENLPSGDYFVSIKHRNHLAMYTLYPQIFNAGVTPFVDFTYQFTPVMGNYPGAIIGDIRALWSGDVNGDAKTVYQGPTNDVFEIFLSVIIDELNSHALTNYITRGYTQKDFNLDGTVIYQGPNNDRSNFLINTTLNHPNNRAFLSNFVLETGIERDSIIINPAWGEVDLCQIDATNPGCDFDKDGYINIIDLDDDNDGVLDADDVENFNPESDSDADGISDNSETGNDGIYDQEIDSNPLSTCDPSPSSEHCVGIDIDGDGYFSNYPETHAQYDEDDAEGCIPNYYNLACACQDIDNDGKILICHNPTGNPEDKKTKSININAWVAHKNHGDTCGPCETAETDCTNGIDDDGDGLIDCEDGDCGKPAITNITPTDLSCPANIANGQIAITATGTNLAYRLNTTSWQSSSSFINLAAGTYTVFVKNSNTDCEVSADITLNPASECIEICGNGIDDDGDGLIDCEDGECGTPVINNVTPIQLTCSGNTNDGQINVDASGQDLQYRLNDGNWQNSAVFIDLGAGDYTIYVKNSNSSCEISSSITLEACTETDCTNGIDDDGDGLIDCEDPDCYLVAHTGASDFDGDGVGDYCDLDDDNDGVLDIDEGGCVQTVYTLNPTNTAAGATISPTGGTFNLVFDLTSGTAITEIGESFNVPVTISPMNNTATGASNTWTGEVISKPSSYINGTIVSVLPNTASFYTGLPLNNSTTEIPLASEFLDEIYNSMLINEQIDPLGTFSITIGAIPSAPSASLLSDSIQLSSSYNADRTLSGRWLAGYYARLDIQNDLYLEIGNVAATAPKTVRFGETYTYNYTAFSYNPGTGPTNSNFRGLITIINSSITFCTQQDTLVIEDTDNDGMPNHLDLDADGDGCYDKIEAGVPGATNEGTATDSLAATSATEVGANGLANAIESDDSQAATVNYTFPQTHLGTNDFQNAAIFISCGQEVCADGVDNDGDGLVDCADGDCASSCVEICDNGIDDDGDGLVDCADGDCASSCIEICDNGIDDDGDGLIDCEDPDCYLVANTGASDFDGDGVGDYCDLDDDNDGVLDIDENSVCAQTVYTLNPGVTAAGASISPTGGSFNIVFDLTAGAAIPEIGTSFNIPVTISPMNNTATGASNTWTGEVVSKQSNIVSVLPNTASFYSGLPPNNSTTEIPLASEFFDEIYSDMLINGQLDQLGTFSITIGAIPTAPSASLLSESIQLYSVYNVLYTPSIWFAGYYARLDIQNELYREESNVTGTAPKTVGFGETYTYNYTAFSNIPGDGPTNTNNRGLISIANSSITFCTQQDTEEIQDTDNNGMPNHLDLDADGDGCYDKIEAGVPGATNDGTATDSLAATSATEVGANGLANAIESDDSQAATVNYTFPQTHLGTNDFQNAAIFISCGQEVCADGVDNDGDGLVDCADGDCASSCIEICDNGIDDDGDGLIDCEDPDCYLVANTGASDFDGDGVGDYCDLDDDNDGILDAIESVESTNPVELLTSNIATATGQGINGLPVLTINVPEGTNQTRGLFIYSIAERDHHADGSTNRRGDNWLVKDPNLGKNYNPFNQDSIITFTGPTGNLHNTYHSGYYLTKYFYPNSPQEASNASFSFDQIGYFLLEEELDALLPSGSGNITINFNLAGVNLPGSLQDETVLGAILFDYVQQSPDLPKAFNSYRFGTYVDLNSNMIENTIDSDIGTSYNDQDGLIMLGSTTNQYLTNGTNSGMQLLNGFDLVGDGLIQNNVTPPGAFTTASEADGISYSVQFGVANQLNLNPTPTFDFYNSTGDPSIEFALVNLIRVKSASPQMDSDGLPNHLDLDSDGDGCYDKIEAGVPGATNDGTATDSLAATSATEVGANGLANAIESDDSQAATVNYTFPQTHLGTNDFQNAAIFISCGQEVCADGVDNDGDGLVDCADGDCASSCVEICDNGIDDDGDGLVDCADGDCASSCVEICDNGIDDDGDGLIDCEDPDCYLVANTGASDFDGDGVGDYCDIDDDNDGILDIDECTPFNAAVQPGGIATMSSNASTAGNANNGITTETGTSTAFSAGSTITDYWEVDLGSIKEIETINVHNRASGNRDRLGNMYVMVSDMAFPTDVNDLAGALAISDFIIQFPANESGDPIIDVGGIMGRYVRLQKSGVNTNSNIINIAEVEVISTCQDTDNDGIIDRLDLDADGDGCYDKIEAGVTGFTTDGSVTDSLAAVTAGEVGNNGLDDDIESDDTAVATTSGSYTITQTNAGTNDFQDATVSSQDCPCSTIDSDGDGVCDAIDIDDDNDGIRDVDECTLINVAPNGTATMSSTYSGSNASNAIDTETTETGVNTAHTNTSGSTEWWEVDLGTIHDINVVNIFNRDDCCQDRFGNVYVLVADTPFPSAATDLAGALANADFTFQLSSTETGDPVINVGGISGRYIRLQKSGSNPGGNAINIAEVQVITTCQDTDMDGLADHLDLDADGDGCYDKIEAGVTGFTTNGSATDSLIITATGANGLADAIESDDTQAATTSGSYTIIQTNTGTNDFQNATVSSQDCPCTTIDSDGDGVCDAIDIDDDNDGIRDVDEGHFCPSFDGSIWANKDNNDIIEISNINGTASQATVIITPYSGTIGDIGFAPDGELYQLREGTNQLYRVNQSTGAVTSVATIPFSDTHWLLNAVSFDENGFAYVGSGSSSQIYKVNPIDGTSSVWHSFSGYAGGDFIFLNGFVYIAWKPTNSNDNVRLYGVVLDANNNYVSHQDLGRLPNATYGLSSDNSGRIFGGTASGNIYSFTPPSAPVSVIPTTVLYDLAGNDKVYGLTSKVESLGSSCQTVDTDSDGIYDHLDLDSDGDGCYDNIEANVPGATNNGSETDSLIVSEVGINGLADAIESDDSQNATTNYPIPQTQSGVNDFQNSLIAACSDTSNNNPVKVLTQNTASASGNGANGLPTLTINVPEGGNENRAILIYYMAEREHQGDGTTTIYGDNWVVKDPDLGTDYNQLNQNNLFTISSTNNILSGQYHGITAGYAYSYLEAFSDIPYNAKFSIEYTAVYLLESDLDALLPTGSGNLTIDFDLLGINIPNSSQDETVLGAIIFDNVGQNTNPPGAFQSFAKFKAYRVAANNVLTAPVDMSAAPDSNSDGIMMLGMASNEDLDNGSNYGFQLVPSYDLLSNGQIRNNTTPLGHNTTNSEPDGCTYSTQFGSMENVNLGNEVSVSLTSSTGESMARAISFDFIKIEGIIGMDTTNNASLPTISIEDITVSENANASTIQICADTISTMPMNVTYHSSDGTALENINYTTKSGTAIIPSGQLCTTVSIPLINDDIYEADNYFYVDLSMPEGAILEDTQAKITINDDDKPTISITDNTVNENGSTTTLDICLSNQSDFVTTVEYISQDDAAKESLDYTSVSNTVSIPAGQLCTSISIPINMDAIDELDERFFVNLINPSNATIGDGQGEITILDDDPPPSISINDVTAFEHETRGVLEVCLSEVSGLPITVDYTTINGTAQAGSDFENTTSSLTIPAGALCGNLVIPIINDYTLEADENLSVNLTNPIYATLNDVQGQIDILNDDTVNPCNNPSTQTFTATLQGLKDAWIDETDAYKNYGRDEKLSLERGGGIDKRALIQFDLSAYTNVEITSAQFKMYLESGEGKGNEVEAHRLLKAWDEGNQVGSSDEVNWGKAKSGNNWLNVGGDLDNYQEGVMTTNSTGWRTMNLNPLLIQAWIEGRMDNNGLILLNKQGESENKLEFTSTEGPNNPKPVLIISYKVCN